MFTPPLIPGLISFDVVIGMYQVLWCGHWNALEFFVGCSSLVRVGRE